jgi:hypothetical protein
VAPGVGVTHPVFRLLGYIEDDLRGVHAKLTEVRAQLSALQSLADERPGFACPVCGIVRPTEGMLRDHLVLVHEVSA